MTSILLLAEFQSDGTVIEVPEVKQLILAAVGDAQRRLRRNATRMRPVISYVILIGDDATDIPSAGLQDAKMIAACRQLEPRTV
jgi:hypothetical protein